MSTQSGMGQKINTQADMSSYSVQTLDSLCKGRTTVLKVFSRVGCPFTRCDAHRLSQLKKRLHALGATLVGITFEDDEESNLKTLWDGDMYLDPERKVYRFFELQRLSKIKLVICLMQKEARKKPGVFQFN